MELRHRGNRSDDNQQMETFQILENPSDDKDEAIKNQKCLLAVPTLLVTMTILIILNSFVYYMDNRLPNTIKTNYSSFDDFVAKRAMSTLVKLANLGPRPVGSYENENLAFNLLKSEINNIINEVGNVNDIEMYNQKVSGSFLLNMKNWKYVLSYQDLQNIIVKIDSKQGFDDAIVLNCHFDSVPAGPGVSDNGVNCAIMVELLRVLVKTANLKRPIIFLFNGGEEIILQASHGFITQHPWFQHAKYIINLDSCGAGGREIMFQTTVSDSYLVDLYARTVPHPHGQAIGEELFQSGIIPSDTDFRIFRDFGNMSGLDLAHYKNGYVYHTKYDNLDQIGPSVLQNTGENLFALAKAMSTHDAPKNRTRSKYVFFDVLGVYMFCYTETSATVANLTIVLMSFYSIALSLRYTTVGMNRREYSVHLLTLVAHPACTVLLCLSSCALAAFALDALGRAMSWYGNQINLTVYAAVAVLAVLSAAVYLPRCESRTAAQWTVSALNGAQLFWTLALLVATMAGLRSAYVLAVVVACPAAVGCALGVLAVAARRPALWTAAYVASLLAPATFVFYLTRLFVDLFVPIAGRFGPAVNPDYVVAALIAASACVTVGLAAPAVAMVREPRVVLAALAGLVVVSVAAVVLTPLGFPYSAAGADGLRPRVQRFDVIHTRRAFYDGRDSTAAARHRDAGFVIVNWDRNSPGTVAGHVPTMRRAVRTDCVAELMCGAPIVGPLAPRSSWIPLARPPALPSRADADVRVTAVTSSPDRGPSSSRLRRRLEFTVTGPERINVYVSPYPGAGVKSWSFGPDEPVPTTVWQGNDVYVIRHSRGAAGQDARWTFWLEQESDRGFDENTINVTVAYSWVVHNSFEPDDELKTFVDSFPRWAHVNYAVASVDAFVF